MLEWPVPIAPLRDHRLLVRLPEIAPTVALPPTRLSSHHHRPTFHLGVHLLDLVDTVLAHSNYRGNTAFGGRLPLFHQNIREFCHATELVQIINCHGSAL